MHYRIVSLFHRYLLPQVPLRTVPQIVTKRAWKSPGGRHSEQKPQLQMPEESGPDKSDVLEDQSRDPRTCPHWVCLLGYTVAVCIDVVIAIQSEGG
ncbi:uncharacterized protein BO80DRAFT_206586 [Aspergillus ibericus CBS 121593]|uniref:Uncharacterized protein n=1 Tax=Aspergillus ibericus CBS 121593 TaxID=1448316 RepID=A0A395HC24_9EURO|nr:hypothetical protein BO80DRAFT_206586 [Aspergillus ibericus CBS 121593]RAL04695.1 hypothetical protein BO80DRAFT_206586 [Aspergillus ibericus CBS 121593]